MGVLLLFQWHLVGKAKDAKSAVRCRAVPSNGIVPPTMLAVPPPGNTDL